MKASFLSRLAPPGSHPTASICVGIDPDPERMPAAFRSDPDRIGATYEFCRSIISSTASGIEAFKFNFAFFEVLGADGWELMRSLLKIVPEGVLTIADAKRGDIGNSASFYARSIFEDLGFDAVTVSPYMGADSIKPFLEYEGTCTFVLARTSNPGGQDFQPLKTDGIPLYERVARESSEWAKNSPGVVGLVVGATDTDAMEQLRSVVPDVPFLVPGIGAQGGDIAAVRHANAEGPMLINSSRGILYASEGDDFAEAAVAAVTSLRTSLTS